MKKNKAELLTELDIQKILSNPYYAIDIDEELTGMHKKIVSEEEFIEAAEKMIKEIGVKKYMRGLLDNLKGDFVV